MTREQKIKTWATAVYNARDLKFGARCLLSYDAAHDLGLRATWDHVGDRDVFIIHASSRMYSREIASCAN